METLAELESRCRLTTQDSANKKLWSSDEWRDYLNEAATEVAVRSLCIEDDTIEIDFGIGQDKEACPEYVYRIQRAKFGTRKLELTDYQTLDESEGPEWEARTGEPVALYEVGDQLRLFPIPTVAGTLTLTAFCTPRKTMAEDEDRPDAGIPRRFLPYLLDWALHLAYEKQDSDTFDANLSARYAGKVEARFGPPRDERGSRPRRINVRHRVRGHYF